jgi:hypothetical protein
MKTWKLVSGILSILMFLMILLQSCAATLGSALGEIYDFSGLAGFLVAVLFLTGGIVSIAVREQKGTGGDIALSILFGLAALIGYAVPGIFRDLKVWGGWALINMILAWIDIGKKSRSDS